MGGGAQHSRSETVEDVLHQLGDFDARFLGRFVEGVARFGRALAGGVGGRCDAVGELVGFLKHFLLRVAMLVGVGVGRQSADGERHFALSVRHIKRFAAELEQVGKQLVYLSLLLLLHFLLGLFAQLLHLLGEL